jgi:(S)-mandelate dehydrogenase
LLNVADYRDVARKRLSRGIYEYIERGTEDEVGLSTIRASLDSIKLAPKVLFDVSTTDTSIELFGKRHTLPMVATPTAIAGAALVRR